MVHVGQDLTPKIVAWRPPRLRLAPHLKSIDGLKRSEVQVFPIHPDVLADDDVSVLREVNQDLLADRQ
jgi:hypothetical protein